MRDKSSDKSLILRYFVTFSADRMPGLKAVSCVVKGDMLADCVHATCCFPCAIVQELNELHAHGFTGEHGHSSGGDPAKPADQTMQRAAS